MYMYHILFLLMLSKLVLLPPVSSNIKIKITLINCWLGLSHQPIRTFQRRGSAVPNGQAKTHMWKCRKCYSTSSKYKQWKSHCSHYKEYRSSTSINRVCWSIFIQQCMPTLSVLIRRLHNFTRGQHNFEVKSVPRIHERWGWGWPNFYFKFHNNFCQF